MAKLLKSSNPTTTDTQTREEILKMLKIPPQRQKMSHPDLESLRSIQGKLTVTERDYGAGNYEAVRLRGIKDQIWSSFSEVQKAEYITYMGKDHSAPVAEVPLEGEAERSI